MLHRTWQLFAAWMVGNLTRDKLIETLSIPNLVKVY